MKTPYKYLLGLAIGVGAGFLLRSSDSSVVIIESAVSIVIRVGRYFFLPLIFFSLPIAVTQLRRAGEMGKILAYSALYILITTAALTLIGSFLTWAIVINPIPVTQKIAFVVDVPTLKMMIDNLRENNTAQLLLKFPSFLLPLLLPAFILGWHFYHDREIAEPAFNLFDSLSRLLYRANRYLLLLMPGFLALLSAWIMIQGWRVVEFNRFVPLLGYLTLLVFFLVIVVFPSILWLSGSRRSPWRSLGSLSAALISASISGDSLFNYGNLLLHLKENLGVPRKVSALLVPIYLHVARSGTALITSVCLLTLMRSYSSLELTLFQIAWTALFSFLISFVLPTIPGRGLSTAFVTLGAFYTRGLDDAWLILLPIFPFLAMLATLLDSATGALILLLVNQHTKDDKETVPMLRV